MTLETRINTEGYLEALIGEKWILYHQIVAIFCCGASLSEALTMATETPDLAIHHKDGDKLNNMPSNLEWIDRTLHIKKHAGNKKLRAERGPAQKPNFFYPWNNAHVAGSRAIVNGHRNLNRREA